MIESQYFILYLYIMEIQHIEAQDFHIGHPVVELLQHFYGEKRLTMEGDIVFHSTLLDFVPTGMGVLTSLNFHLGETISRDDPDTVVMTKVLLAVALAQVDSTGDLRAESDQWYRLDTAKEMIMDCMKEDLLALAQATHMAEDVYMRYVAGLDEWERSGKFI